MKVTRKNINKIMLLPLITAASTFFGACEEYDVVGENHGQKEEQIFGAETINPVNYTMSYDCTLKAETKPFKMVEYTYASQQQSFDLHLEVIPLYISRGDGSADGDYYAVKGYVVAHNAMLNLHREEFRDDNDILYTVITPYLAGITLKSRLLGRDGSEIQPGEVTFFNTPLPETTIGSTTYTTGLDITLNTPFNFGAQKTEEGWKPTIMGGAFPSWNWKDTHKKTISDITVEMNTDVDTREVEHKFVTNNWEKMEVDKLPNHLKTDQKEEFSWIWHVNKGCKSSKDYCLDNMKMAIRLQPQYFVNGTYFNHQYNPMKWYGEEVGCATSESELTWVIELPSVYRYPVGELDMMNATSRYVKNLTITSSNNLDSKKISKALRSDAHYTDVLCEGKYRITYSLITGDGDPIGDFAIDDVEIKANQTTEISTLDAHEVTRSTK